MEQFTEFKDTKFGKVPSDWMVIQLNEMIERGLIIGHLDGNHGELYPKSDEFVDSGVPYLSANTIESGIIKYDKSKFLTFERATKFKKGIAIERDILFAHNATVGPVAILKNDYEFVILSTTLTYYRCNVQELIPEYLVQFMQSVYFVRQYERVMKQSTRNQIPITLQRDFYHIVPKIEEQHKIASILSTWDNAIELKEKLIELKKEQKKGLMQRLLTGKVRVAGFNGEWIESKLGDLLKERKEIGYNDLELLAITSQKGIVRRSEVDIKDNSSEDKSKYKRIMPLDIGYNTMRMWQGVSSVSKYEGIVSPAYTILKPTNKVDSNFIGFLFKAPNIVNLFRRYSQGLVDDTLNLKYENLKLIKVTVPQDIREQKAIAEILLCMNHHIELLESELECFKQQKKGIMESLLTGKVRVKV
nr:restriction endonuclease subunit S [Paenibacillus anseongense]